LARTAVWQARVPSSSLRRSSRHASRQFAHIAQDVARQGLGVGVLQQRRDGRTASVVGDITAMSKPSADSVS
jgi:hypothetical protein